MTLDRIDAALSCSGGLDLDPYVKQNAQFPASPSIEREVARVSLLPLASPSAFLSDQALIPDFQYSLRHAQRQHRAIIDAIIRREEAGVSLMASE